jgi:hypothetical protein
MLRTLTDRLYGTNGVIKWLKNKHPEEEVVFASAATILETTQKNQIGWSLRRLFQRRGVMIITRNQIVLKDSMFSFYTVFWLFMFAFSLFAIFQSRSSDFILWAILSAIFLLQRLPYQRQIPLKDIRELKLKPIRGILAKGSLLTVYLENNTINIVPAQLLNDDIMSVISPRTD